MNRFVGVGCAAAISLSGIATLAVAAPAADPPAVAAPAMSPTDAAKISAASVLKLVPSRRRGYDLTYVARTTMQKDLPAWRIDAGKGGPAGSLMLGLCNYYGLGGAANRDRGLALITAAANAGHGEAMAVYSIILRNGTRDVRPDADAANEWLGKSIEHKSVIGQDELAPGRRPRLIVDGKIDDAMHAYETGAKTGNLSARVALAGVLRRAWLRRENLDDCIRLLDDAASQGHIGAMIDLGDMYAYGRFTDHDAVKAKRWLDAAADTDDPRGISAAAHAYEVGALSPNWTPDTRAAGALWAKLTSHTDPYSVYASYLADQLVPTIRVVDHKASMARLDDASQRGVAETYAFIGMPYYTGQDNTPKNPARCVQYFEDGVTAGDPRAVFQRGCAYRFGYAAKANEDKARDDYMAAARLGVPQAMTSMALRYRSGRGVEFDPELGWLCYLSAACAGDPEAMVEIAQEYGDGSGRPKDVEKAKRWAHAAIALGAPAGYNELARLAGAEEAFFHQTQMPKEAMDLYEAGAKAGSIECAVKLGESLVFGRSMPQDIKRGLALLNEATARDDHGLALFSIGNIYAGTDGPVPYDPLLALHYLHLSADRGNGDAWASIGTFYENGSGVPKSQSEAMHCFEKSAALGSGRGVCRLGMIYEYAMGVPKDHERAMQLFRQAADLDDEDAMSMVAFFLLHQDKPDEARAIVLAERAIFHGSGHVGNTLGQYYAEKEDYVHAIIYYDKAIALGDRDAMNNKGVLYRFGHGVPQDLAQAAALYKRASDFGSPDGSVNYAWCLENGNGVTKDMEAAYQLCAKYAAKNFPDAMFHAGRMLFDGRGCVRDQQAGAILICKAADAGHVQAKQIAAVLRDKGFVK